MISKWKSKLKVSFKHMKDWFYARAATYLLSKKAAGLKVTRRGYDPLMDIYFLSFDGDKKSQFQIISVQKDKVICKKTFLDRPSFKKDCELYYTAIPWLQVKVIHHYKTFASKKTGIKKAIFERLIFIKPVRWFFRIRKESRLEAMNDRHKILEHLRQMMHAEENLSLQELFERIYGFDVIYTSKGGEFEKELELIIESLVYDGLVKKIRIEDSYDIHLTAQGLARLSEYEIEITRHEDALNTAKAMKNATIGMLIAVSIQALISLIKT